ncbi:Spout1 [Symbiodinium pilosum]|uniref:Spout1 protein n=1 Tax=Symbiodinium pilosum TaxID=2952 RepID=A0A812YQ47_SYMPI|nr:Spout1 [Symbiodinium pilosum]
MAPARISFLRGPRSYPSLNLNSCRKASPKPKTLNPKPLNPKPSFKENAQGGELKAVLVGQVARALTIYGVDEVVIFEDRSDAAESEEDGVSNSMAFFARNLQYLETPQYLRKQLVPVHKDLKWVGLLAPLDAPHHLRKYENLPYREGVVLKKQMDRPQMEGDEEESGCLARHVSTYKHRAVHLARDYVQDHVPAELGKECPWEGGYDLTIGTSERGESLGLGRLPKFRHLLLAFGGLGGFEEVLADAKSGYEADTDAASLFSRYVNVCPRQMSRTIRTEEALLIALAILDPLIAEK